MDEQRALLDDLMGAARNLTEEERRGFKEIRWDDKEVCSFYLIRFCPHDLFFNTRSDLGECPRIHDPKLKESFEKSSRHDRYAKKFEHELVHFCETLVMDLDRRVRHGRERLSQEVEPSPPPPLSAEKSEQLKNLLEQVEALGESGKVDEAEALMRKVEALNAQKTALKPRPSDMVLAMAQEKKIALCDVCGSFLRVGDAAERTRSHLTGKQHVGFGLIRDFLAQYKEAKEKAKEEERLASEKEMEERRKQTEKGRESRRRTSDTGDRDRHRDRDRDNDRYRNHVRDRERSYDRNKRPRNGRDGRDRSRTRSPIHGSRKSSRSPARQY